MPFFLTKKKEKKVKTRIFKYFEEIILNKILVLINGLLIKLLVAQTSCIVFISIIMWIYGTKKAGDINSKLWILKTFIYYII